MTDIKPISDRPSDAVSLGISLCDPENQIGVHGVGGPVTMARLCTELHALRLSLKNGVYFFCEKKQSKLSVKKKK